MTDMTVWGVREDPEGFAITKNGEDFMGWFRTEADADAGLQSLLEGDEIPTLLHRIRDSKRPTLILEEPTE